MNVPKPMVWFCMGCFALMVVLNLIVSHQRDTVRRASIELASGVVTVTCKEQTK